MRHPAAMSYISFGINTSCWHINVIHFIPHQPSYKHTKSLLVCVMFIDGARPLKWVATSRTASRRFEFWEYIIHPMRITAEKSSKLNYPFVMFLWGSEVFNTLCMSFRYGVAFPAFRFMGVWKINKPSFLYLHRRLISSALTHWPVGNVLPV